MSARENELLLQACCTHCGNCWEPVPPTAANELRQWPKVAMCPRCGYLSLVREVNNA